MPAIGGLSKAILAGPMGGGPSCNLKYNHHTQSHTESQSHTWYLPRYPDKDISLLATNYKVIMVLNLPC